MSTNPVLIPKLTYNDLTRLEVDRFHEQSGISLVDMAQMQTAQTADGELDMSKMPNLPLHRLDNTLLWLAVQRKTPGATWEQALGGNWDWAEVADADPKGDDNGSKPIGG